MILSGRPSPLGALGCPWRQRCRFSEHAAAVEQWDAWNARLSTEMHVERDADTLNLETGYTTVGSNGWPERGHGRRNPFLLGLRASAAGGGY